MHTSKFFHQLSSLKKNKREIADFERFVKSPFFNPKEELTTILWYVKDHWNLPEAQMKTKLEKKEAYFAIFPKEKRYNAKRMNDYLYRLSLLLEKYFAIKEMQEQPNQEQLFLADALKKRGLDTFYFKETATLQAKLEEQEKTSLACNVSIYLDLARIKERVYYHPNTLMHSETESHRQLADAIEHLDAAYLIKKLQLSCGMYSRKVIFGATVSLRLIDSLLESAKKDFSDNLTIKAYSGILELFRTKDISKIDEIKSLVFNLAKLENIDYGLDLISQFINALPSHKGRLELYFELYKFAEDNDLLLEHGYISPDNLSNIIHLGCVLGKHDWVSEFIDKYIPHLHINIEKGETNKKTKEKISKKRENVKWLFKAYQSYYNKNYKEAYDFLHDLKLKDVSYGLRFHILILKILLDDKDDTLSDVDFDARCRAFRTYLNKKRKTGDISAAVQRANLNFIKIIPKIHNWKYDRTPKNEMLDELKACQDVIFRGWLEHKIKKLGRRN